MSVDVGECKGCGFSGGGGVGWVCVCVCIALCSVCATTQLLICLFPVFSVLCVLFCSETCHTPWIGSVLYAFFPSSMKSVFFQLFWKFPTLTRSLVSPTFRFWLTRAPAATDSIVLTNLVWVSGWHVTLSPRANLPHRLSEPAAFAILDRYIRMSECSFFGTCVTSFQRMETTMRDDRNLFQQASELASAHHFSSFLCVLIPSWDVSGRLQIFALGTNMLLLVVNGTSYICF